MIYLFAGDDTKNKLNAYKNFQRSISKEMEVFFINKNDFDTTQVESLYSGAGLFFSKCTVIFSNIFEKEQARDFILEKLKFISDSENDFVFLEGKVTKPIFEAFKKVGAEFKIFDLPKEKKERFNNFLLADALAERNKLNLWIYFRQAMDLGVGMEELIGVLFWKAKDMLMKRNFNKFSEIELQNFAGRLSYLLPEARKRGLEDEAVFEQFLLEAF